MNINKSDLRKFRKHHKDGIEAEGDLAIVKMTKMSKSGKEVTVPDAHNLVRLMHKRLQQFEQAMAAKYGYDYNSHDISFKTGEIKIKPQKEEWRRL